MGKQQASQLRSRHTQNRVLVHRNPVPCSRMTPLLRAPWLGAKRRRCPCHAGVVARASRAHAMLDSSREALNGTEFATRAILLINVVF